MRKRNTRMLFLLAIIFSIFILINVAINDIINSQNEYMENGGVISSVGYIRETSEKSGEIGEAKFGHSVEEKIIERETPLKESDFEKLLKGQHLTTEREREIRGDLGIKSIIETVGEYDGTVYMKNPGGYYMAIYYKMDEDTYVVLFFVDGLPHYRRLESIAVWNAEGKKQRDINIGEVEIPERKRDISIDGYWPQDMDDYENLPKRFGYVIEENIKERNTPLKESDFEQLRVGQYGSSTLAEARGSEYVVGIVDVIGAYDGLLMLHPRSPGTGMADSAMPYYIIDDNTYVILFFVGNNMLGQLTHVEVWDAEGNKLRDIELIKDARIKWDFLN